MNGDTQQNAFTLLHNHAVRNKIPVALWCTRGLTLMFSFLYMLPLAWDPYYYYYKAMAAYAATSALRLHQRRPVIRPNLQTLSSIMMEDSCHYLLYTALFFYVSPITLALLPVISFALIHFASYSVVLLDVLGPNSMFAVRQLISALEMNTRTILNLIALTEIFLMPVCFILVFKGSAGFFTPVLYHFFITKRYKSLRNPCTKMMFTELSIIFTRWAHHKLTPSLVKSGILGGIQFVTWMCPSMPPTEQQRQ